MLESCKNAFSNISLGSREIEHPKTIRTIMEKLPNYMQDRWRRRVYDINESECRGECFKDLVDIVTKEASILSNPLYGKHLIQSQPKKTEKKGNSSSKTVSARVNANVADHTQKTLKCYFCNEPHHLNDCKALMNKPENERRDFVMKKGLCFGCLRSGHAVKECRRKLSCKTCKGLHPTLFHRKAKPKTETKAGEKSTKEGEETKEIIKTEHTPVINVGVLTNHTKASKQKLRVIPVKVRASDGSFIVTYAFLDSGSTASFCTKKLQQQLNLKTSGRAKLCVSTVQSENMPLYSLIVPGLEISDLEENNFVKLPPLYTLDKIPVDKEDIIRSEDLEEWPSLQTLVMPMLDVDVGLMLGVNVSEALEPLEVINSQDCGGPFAFRTRLGWVTCGPAYENEMPEVKVNKVTVNKVNVEEMLENLYNQEFHDLSSNKPGLSNEDHKWIEKVEK